MLLTILRLSVLAITISLQILSLDWLAIMNKGFVVNHLSLWIWIPLCHNFDIKVFNWELFPKLSYESVFRNLAFAHLVIRFKDIIYVNLLLLTNFSYLFQDIVLEISRIFICLILINKVIYLTNIDFLLLRRIYFFENILDLIICCILRNQA